MEKEKLLEEVVSQIRACLVSTKGRCDIRQVRNDYRMLMGGEIPYVQLGYKNLEQFICSVPSLSTTRLNGQILIDAKQTEKSSHIANFIDKQKTGKKKYRAPPRQVVRHNFNGAPMRKWVPKFNKRSYQSSPRPAAVSHNQFVNIPTPTRSTNTVLKISNRLHVNKKEPEPLPQTPQSRPAVVDVENAGSLTVKAKKRITKIMANLNTNSDDGHLNGVFPTEGSNVEMVNNNSVLTPEAIKELQQESLAAVDLQNPVWKWSSSEDSPESLKNLQVRRRQQQDDNTNPIMEFTGDHLADLEKFVKLHKLGELEIKMFPTKSKPHKPACYNCRIKVGVHKDSNYPVDCKDEASAKQIAAKNLLDQLLPLHNKRHSLLISDDRDILERIPPIVKLHHHGVWNWQIEADYAEMFNEQLPINWLEVIDSIPCILVLPVLTKFVLRFCNPGEKGIATSPIFINVSVPSNTVKFEDDGSLLAEITCVASAGEIWCRQLETPESGAFSNMISKLEEYYNTHEDSEKVSQIDVGGYYVALYEHMWCRVRVFDVNNNNVNCFCIDFGDEWIVPKSCIFRLHRQFAKEQAQAFVCRLAGVEELYEASKTSEYLNSLVGKTVQVQVDETLDDAARSNPNDPALSVVLYDTEADVIINENLISCIAIESASPILNKSTPTEVYVTHALEDGSVYLQVHSKGFEHLAELLQEIEQNIMENKLELPNTRITPDNSKDKLLLAKGNEDDRWYRVKIVDWSPDRKYAQLLFVDYGTTSIVTVKTYLLYFLDDLSDIISKFPYQALKVRMAISNIPPNFVEKINTLLPSDQSVLVKLIMNDEENGPLVEIFKRSETDNVLFSVNTAIAAETEFEKKEEASGSGSKAQSTKLQRLISLNQFDDATKNVPSSGSLSCPPLPKIGNYFDVKIPCAVHPHNFCVQPYESQDRLSKLMAALQEKYKDVHHSPIQIDDVVPGKIYASKHEDGMWYRTSVIKVIHSGSISVFYCDFGYYANLTLKQLIPLDPDFMDLPHQAIKAKLAGIQPKNSKWSMDDCKFFEALVCRKSFVSILVGTEKDVLYRSDTVLSLKLIDTSTKVDIHIDKVLVQKDIAIAITNQQEQ